jgi:hypothetical protein
MGTAVERDRGVNLHFSNNEFCRHDEGRVSDGPAFLATCGIAI